MGSWAGEDVSRRDSSGSGQLSRRLPRPAEWVVLVWEGRRLSSSDAFPFELLRPRGRTQRAAHLTTRRSTIVLSDQTETTTGGPLGKVIGKSKELAGSLAGKDELAREGRLQQAQAEAEIEAERRAREAEQREEEAELSQEQVETELERERLENEVAAQEREMQIERDRQQSELRAEADAQREQAAAHRERELQESRAQTEEQQAERERVAAAEQEIRLEREARKAEAEADAIDPKEDK